MTKLPKSIIPFGQWFVIPFLLLTPALSFASETLGSLANTLSAPVDLFTGIIYKICYVIGFVLIIGSILQYKRHRDNPNEVRLSQPVMLLLLGIIIAILPLIPQWLSTNTVNPAIRQSIR